MPENPYAAPQASLDQPAAREFGERPRGGWTERDAGAEGTRLCMLAVWNTLGCLGAFVIGGIVLNLGLLTLVVMLVCLAAAAFTHGRGVYQLLGVAAETQARGLITLSLITFLIAVLGNVVEAVSRISRAGTLGLEYNLGQAILSLTTYSTLTLALARIARWHHEDGARWSAQVAFGIIVVCYGALVGFYVTILTPAGLEWLRSWQGPDARRLVMTLGVAALALGIVGAGFYTRCLWLLNRTLRDS